MADTVSADATEGASSAGRVGAWTDTERRLWISIVKFQLTLRILATLLPEGKGIEWKNINMPNRTLKAVQGQWTAMVAQMRDLNDGGEGSSFTPKSRGSRKKSTPKKAAAVVEDAASEDNNAQDDEAKEKKPITPKKRTATKSVDGSVTKRKRTPEKPAPKVNPEVDAAEGDTEPKAAENEGEQ
ncbi:hypothetical protein CCHL11_00424 [Colletotrichum chlorophyti]|uniref:Uncharacterized protein n=1 Tax=Colletotrichum chlorophyti TaxID=708187 RepID=A0A1Q8RVB9_9PEZI|nr:hypothetical protein CCHL11_00424 [Colletotrichum chlorophyti]